MKEMKRFLALIIIVVGYIISILIGALLYWRGETTLDSIAIGLLVSILITLVGILIDINKNQGEILADINKNQDEIIKALGISKHLNKDGLRDYLYDLTNDYVAATSHQQDRLFVAEAEKIFKHCVRVISDLAKGKFYADTEEKRSDFILSKIRDPSVVLIRAITYFAKSNPDWWRHEDGKLYLAEQKRAVDRGAKITRIIIQPNEPLPSLSELIKAQEDAGIRIITVPEASLTHGLCANILICDDKWVTESHFNGAGKHDGGWVSTDATNVSLAREKWDRLLDLKKTDSGLE